MLHYLSDKNSRLENAVILTVSRYMLDSRLSVALPILSSHHSSLNRMTNPKEEPPSVRGGHLERVTVKDSKPKVGLREQRRVKKQNLVFDSVLVHHPTSRNTSCQKLKINNNLFPVPVQRSKFSLPLPCLPRNSACFVPTFLWDVPVWQNRSVFLSEQLWEPLNSLLLTWRKSPGDGRHRDFTLTNKDGWHFFFLFVGALGRFTCHLFKGY